MAEMIPAWFTQGPNVELHLWRLLRQNLPDTWTIWHAFRIQVGPAPVEIDFLCYAPDRGLIAIEVKGGTIAKENGAWFQDGRALKQSPYQQIARAGFALRDHLCATLACVKLPFPFLKLVWFPAVQRPEYEPPESIGCTLYAQAITALQATFEALLPVSIPPTQALPAERLKQALATTLAYQTSWQTRRTLAEARITQLTEEQAHILDAFTHFPRLRVRGCAGSGKTLLALRRAYQLANNGKRVLFLCFNLLLANHLQKIAAGIDGLHITAVNELFLTLLNRTDDGTPDFWRRLARDVLPAAEAYRTTTPIDAVIIDEGQDFSPPVWTAVKALIPEKADLIIFYDPHQNIFQRDLTAMPTLPWPDAQLTRNCRNTRAVGEILRPYAPNTMLLHENAPTGEPPENYTAENKSALRQHLQTRLTQLIEDQAIPEQDIVLMGAHALHKMDLAPILTRHPKLRYYTYRKFKGLEAPILILIDVNDADPLWDTTAQYTAISRAIHKLILLRLR